jgi:hydroxyethylthiazole kinase-like uncharacterized protein yjeF
MPLPDWLDPLYDADAQRAADRWAIEDRGIPGLELMERAGSALGERAARVAPEGRIVVACGKGNNGGDGLVAARWLREHGREVDVLLVGAAEDLKGDARESLEALSGPPPRSFEPGALDGAALVVDALLGTGFTGEPREPLAGAIAAIEAAAVPVVACDIASGVDASTGAARGIAVHATCTVTFDHAKPGHWIEPGKSHTGHVTVVDIGIPAGAPVDPPGGLIADRVRGGIPRREPGSTKFASGSVLVCGGSPGLTGAPCLCSRAAMRAGAGYVTACVPSSLSLVFEIALTETMSVGLPDVDGVVTERAAEIVLERSRRVDAVALGPGLGRAPEAVAYARRLAAELPVPLLLDADGLNAHAGGLFRLATRSAPAVLTPHGGELARLLDVSTDEVRARRLELALQAARTARAIVVLKGDDSIVATPEGRFAVSRGGAPGLATAGTGDVLSGVTAAFLAKRMEPFHAACAAVHVHVRAGQLAATDRDGPDGVIASDVIERLPHVLAPGAGA